MNTDQAIHTSEFWLHAPRKPELLHPITQCPSYQFSCPECGSLEVFFTKLNSATFSGKCLDCQSTWEEVMNA